MEGEHKLSNRAQIKRIHGEWLDLYLNNCQKLNKSMHTVINYRCDLEKFLIFYEQISHQNINKARADIIETYKDYLSGIPVAKKTNFLDKIKKTLGLKSHLNKNYYISIAPLSINTKRRHLSSVKNFFEFLVQYYDDQNKLFEQNPVKSKLHSIKLKDMDVIHTELLNESQWHALIQKINSPKEKLIIHLLYYGGLRLAELTTLKASAFNRRNETITFVRKGGEIHQLKIQEFELIYALLNDYLATLNYKQDELFTNRFGKVLSTRSMYKIIKNIFTKAGITNTNIGPHSFRKACATNMYRSTKDILLVRNYLNHKDATVTQTYIDY